MSEEAEMMTPQHAAVLMYMCPDYRPAGPMVAAMLTEGLLSRHGVLTPAGRKLARLKIRTAMVRSDPTTEQAPRWEACSHDNMPRFAEYGDECPDCGATYEWLKKQE